MKDFSGRGGKVPLLLEVSWERGPSLAAGGLTAHGRRGEARLCVVLLCGRLYRVSSPCEKEDAGRRRNAAAARVAGRRQGREEVCARWWEREGTERMFESSTSVSCRVGARSETASRHVRVAAACVVALSPFAHEMGGRTELREGEHQASWPAYACSRCKVTAAPLKSQAAVRQYQSTDLK